MQITIAVKVGIPKAANAHFRLPVSFFIVKNVVEQGQCKSEKVIKDSATHISHPLATNKFSISDNSLTSSIAPVSYTHLDVYKRQIYALLENMSSSLYIFL